MRLFSLEAFRAFFLKLMGCTYQEIGLQYDLAPRSIKYHIKAIKRTYPDAEKFFLSNVTDVPTTMKEKVKLATELAEAYIKHIPEKLKSPESPPETQVTTEQPVQVETFPATVSTSAQISQPKISTSLPTVLLEAIDRSVSAYYEKSDDITPELVEEEQQPKEPEEKPKTQDKTLYLALIFGLGLLFLVIVFLTRQPSVIQPAPQPVNTPPRPNFVKLSQLGI